MNKLLQKLGIDETYTKRIKHPIYDKVKENTYPKGGYNYMADLMYLPTTKEGYKYLFCIVDLWTNKFDMEPLKKKESKDVLKALQTVFQRGILQKPKASIRTDNGTEFQDVFHKWLYDQNILHRVSEPYRHQQLANVEMLNGVLGRLFNGYMNAKEMETKKQYNEWTDVIDIIRTDLNEIRKLKDGNPYNDIMKDIVNKKPKFKVGDIVYRKLERPMNALGHYQNTLNFRMGDYQFDIKNPKRINHVLYYPRNIRYILDGMPHVSYAEFELLPAKEKDQKYTVKAIIGKKKEKGVTKYLIWWQGFKKDESTYEPLEQLIEDGLKPMIDAYEQSLQK